ncbi:hypothetical protein [Ectothiorhodospira shaposhnikovii]|uniref:hypothetical protein n=1 Tax=Ectothiorhodospira shaposhnikovii TaxID=1054 RepID=UPI0019034CF3|nr:hypothetical protein [Ectothiorhodospira shaposhnikovii]
MNMLILAVAGIASLLGFLAGFLMAAVLMVGRSSEDSMGENADFRAGRETGPAALVKPLSRVDNVVSNRRLHPVSLRRGA